MAYGSNIKISMPAPPMIGTSAMRSVMQGIDRENTNDAMSALRERALVRKMGPLVAIGLSLVCVAQSYYTWGLMGMNASEVLGSTPGGTFVTPWAGSGWPFETITVPRISIDAAVAIAMSICLIFGTSYAAAKYAEHRRLAKDTKDWSHNRVAAVLAVILLTGGAYSIATSTAHLFFTIQGSADAGDTASAKSAAARQVVLSLEDVVSDAGLRVNIARAGVEAARRSEADYAKRMTGKDPWLMNATTKNGPRRPYVEAIERAEKALVVANLEYSRASQRRIDAVQDQADAIAAPNTVKKLLDQAGAVIGVQGEAFALIFGVLVAVLEEVVRLGINMTMGFALGAAVASYRESEAEEWRMEQEAERNDRRLREAEMAPVKAATEARILTAEAKARHVTARGAAFAESIERAHIEPAPEPTKTFLEPEPQDLPDQGEPPESMAMFFDGKISAVDEFAAPDTDAPLTIPPMPSEQGESDAFYALTTSYQQKIRDARRDWIKGKRPSSGDTITHKSLEDTYGLKSNNARIVFFQWLVAKKYADRVNDQYIIKRRAAA